MDFLADLSLVDGPLWWFSILAGIGGALFLLWRRSGKWPLYVGAAVLLAVGTVLLVHWLLIFVTSTFPAELPPEVLAWSIPPVAALFLLLLRIPRASWRGRAAGVVAVLGVVLLSSVQINGYFGLHHTLGDLMGTAVARIPPLEESLKRQPAPAEAVPLSQWHPTDDLPTDGILRKASIPGTVSGFEARDAFIYLPPAYQAAQRPSLPVLVLFSGQPGAPSDWLTGGALRSHMDRFAASHNGIAPVVVVADPNGTPDGNTLCLDSRIAKADTYLSQDVTSWIRQNLDVDADPGKWAVGGFSFGGTCAMQMGTRHPEIFTSILAFSSEKEPALAKERRKTIEAAYGDDEAAFDQQTPLTLMAQKRYPGSAVYFGAGARDPEFIGYMNLLANAARNAGFSVKTTEIANTGHSWDAPSMGMADALGFLAARWGIQE
ncbi:alpha/beta hydrolase family protein [Arthrobacter sp. ISL-30]|uniref:alpha/beta hydrolase n=1 Tax=Arthrobacter sp. ISL-30 TaxID=2819109 RepID=UPI001BEBAAA8|nr:alpha/beta hydrolase-fold protein [Arthrobacter sp. ISL-30]MBT2513966.1 esterase [Arthrobacter sp. ISL-30]